MDQISVMKGDFCPDVDAHILLSLLNCRVLSCLYYKQVFMCLTFVWQR